MYAPTSYQHDVTQVLGYHDVLLDGWSQIYVDLVV